MRSFTTIDDVLYKNLPDYVDDALLDFSPNSLKVLQKRYVRRGADGLRTETIAGMFYRVASVVARAGGETPEDEVAELTYEFYQLMVNRRFFPNSPTFTGAGTGLGQLAACFVLGVADDMGKEPQGIFNTLRDAALIQQTGGGNGFSFSRLRPAGDRVSASGGHATGPLGFMKTYDGAFGEIAQGGTRRGANMAVLRVDHPDIEAFIECKPDEKTLTNFNISVALTDEFMRCVEKGEAFNLVNPRDGAVWKQIDARDLFDKIVKYAHHNGEPGALFIDAANRSNPVPHLGDYEATNPCGEQYLLSYENCCLGSINLADLVIYSEERSPRFDWHTFQAYIHQATQFLDCVVSANKYVPAVPQLREAALRCRRLGLGYMGLADVMYKLGIPYGSAEGCEFSAQVTEFMRYHALVTSANRAEKYGAFPAIKGSIYDKESANFYLPPMPIKGYTHSFGRPPLYWQEVRNLIRLYGVRNATLTTLAPTGTIATVCGCEGYGCEPVFALSHVRHFKDGDKDVELTYASPIFEKALRTSNMLSEVEVQAALEHVARTGNCQDLAHLPASIREAFVVSSDITAEQHVRMQAAIQAFICNSISKTCNFPAGATEADVAQAYKLAWELGCKGLTVYVTDSRQQVVLETQASRDKKAAKAPEPVHKILRPARLQGETYRQETPLGVAYVTINSQDKEPFEVFLNVGKAGSEVAAVSEALGRMFSLVLRIPSPLSRIERLGKIGQELFGIGGGRHIGFGPKRVKSLPDGLSQVFAKHLNGDAVIVEVPPTSSFATGEICPDCGDATLIFLEGCNKCSSCGYSEC